MNTTMLQTYWKQAVTYLEQGQYEQAQKAGEYLRPYAKKNPDVCNFFIAFHQQQNQVEQAFYECEKAIKNHPKSANLYFNRGLILLGVKNL